MSGSLEGFLRKHKLSLVQRERIAKGWSSEVFLVGRGSKGARGKKQGARAGFAPKSGKQKPRERFALKIEKPKSPRIGMVRREVENLKTANNAGVGPKLVSFDLKRKIILMEFIDGVTLREFLFDALPAKIKSKKTRSRVLHNFLDKLFEQAEALDKAGLDHGQLAGKGKNILVREIKGRGKSLRKGKGPRHECEPVIIDFEKASPNRRVHNRNQIEGFLLKNKYGAFAKKTKEILQG
ncbi:MAG: hypothetical protein V1676_01175 [Candidatus Diapherotrites archaeon]